MNGGGQIWPYLCRKKEALLKTKKGEQGGHNWLMNMPWELNLEPKIRIG
jgi:hypothetical protein